MIISFSGTSGSGKSTVIAQIRADKIFRGRKIVMGKEDNFLSLKLLKRILGDEKFSKYKEEKFFKRRYNDVPSRTFSLFCYIFYPIVVYIELLMEYIWYQILFKRAILLADRYFYDYSVTFKNVLEIDNRFVQWLYNLSPRPYLAFLIDIDLNTTLLRNKNNIPGKVTSNSNKLFHENILRAYREIGKKHKLLAISNNGALEDTVMDVKKYILDKEKLINVKKIALCGLDGTGKTTLANMLAGYAASLNIKSKVVHFYHQNLLFKLFKLFGFYKIDQPKAALYRRSRERSAIERLKRTPFILALLRFLDSYVQYLFLVSFNRDKLIIFDRYFYDYLVSFEYLNIKPRAFFSKLIPVIQYKFLLNTSPTIANQRKPESVKDFFIKCHGIYLKMAAEQNIKIIDTENKRPSNVLHELVESINL